MISIRDTRSGSVRSQAENIGEGTLLVLTDDEECLDDDVADHADAVGVDEAGVVGHDDGDVEGSDQDQPIPAGLEHAVVRQDEAGLLEGAGLVFG